MAHAMVKDAKSLWLVEYCKTCKNFRPIANSELIKKKMAKSFKIDAKGSQP